MYTRNFTLLVLQLQIHPGHGIIPENFMSRLSTHPSSLPLDSRSHQRYLYVEDDDDEW